MTTSINMVYSCDHIVSTKEKKYSKIELSRNPLLGYPDQFPANIDVCRVDYITSIDGKKEYTLGVDYSQTVSKNIIEWNNEEDVPAPGEKYSVYGLFQITSTAQYTDETCLRCDGNGWYINILENMKKTSGMEKLAQDVLKILFTDKISEDGYGSTIKNSLAQNIYSEATLIQRISSSVDDCVNQIKEMQASLLNEGCELEDEERLDSIEVVNATYVREETACYIKLRILNTEGNSINFVFKV